MNLLEALIVLLDITRYQDSIPAVRRARKRVSEKAEAMRVHRAHLQSNREWKKAHPPEELNA